MSTTEHKEVEGGSVAGDAGGAAPSVKRVPVQRQWVAATMWRLRSAVVGDAGMSTVEYAIGTLAAAAFGAVLYTVVSGDTIPDALTGIIERALNTSV